VISVSFLRYLPQRPFPPYAFVPGRNPHPVSDPAGHSHGATPAAATPLDPQHPTGSPEFLYALDLFNHGYYWEAHEAWESLWHAAGHTGPIAVLLKALIKLAAAGVKSREGNAAGVRRHARRAAELFRSAAESHQPLCGMFEALGGQKLIESCNTLANDPAIDMTPSVGGLPVLGIRMEFTGVADPTIEPASADG
jgi:hypothetical protein